MTYLRRFYATLLKQVHCGSWIFLNKKIRMLAVLSNFVFLFAHCLCGMGKRSQQEHMELSNVLLSHQKVSLFQKKCFMISQTCSLFRSKKVQGLDVTFFCLFKSNFPIVTNTPAEEMFSGRLLDTVIETCF